MQGPTKCVRRDNDQSITWTGHPESRFTFDLVADEQVTQVIIFLRHWLICPPQFFLLHLLLTFHLKQESVFKVAGLPMVENCMEGYNSCMFAYGQVSDDTFMIFIPH